LSDSLEGHAGSIQAALILDMESESVSYMDISIHGMNGMQPNLDLVHLLVRIANYESVPVKLAFQVSWFFIITRTDYVNPLTSLDEYIRLKLT